MTLVWTQDRPAVRRFFVVVRWLPALAAAAYLATVAVLGPALVRDVGWDTDVSGPLALAERLRGSGPVYIPHYGEWTSLWWLLATRTLPWHAQLWEATGYVFAVTAAALLGWATARVAGRWAGLTAAAAALVVGPFALRSLLTVALHVTNSFTAAVLGVALVLLTRTRSWPLALAVGLLAGANAASDPLLWIAGIVPFVLAAALLARTTRRIDVALRAAITLAVTIVSAVATNLVMHGLGYHVIGLSVGLARLHALPANTLHLGRMVALLGGANYALPGGYPREPLRALLALLVLAAVVTPVVAAVKLTVRRAEPTVRAYACYWGAATMLLGIVFVITPNAAALGPDSMNYLLTLSLAAGTGVALLAARSRRGQLAVALAIATVGAINIAGIAKGHAEIYATNPIRTYEPPLVRLLERKGVTRGYGGYWDAQNITWQSGMRLLIAPVQRCAPQLCPYNFFTIRSWYEPHPGPTFLILDATNRFIPTAPRFVEKATATYHLGPLTVYLFDYDITRHIRLRAT
jgi:hypothetical protein